MMLNVDEIKDLMRTAVELGVTELRISQSGDGFEMNFGRACAPAAPGAAPAPPAAAPLEETAPVPAAAAAAQGNVVRSPIVGTFYAMPSPDAQPYVKVGDMVHKGDVLFIIESMKLMNEVTSEFDGKVTEIMAKSGEPVEYGQPLMRIE